jgi:hypothetical protein
MPPNQDHSGTVGDLIAGRKQLWLACAKCHHSVQVNLKELAAVRGGRYKLQAIVDHAVCSACGHRGAEVRLLPRSRPYQMPRPVK